MGSTPATAGGEFGPGGRQMQIDLAQLKVYESLVGNFYAIDANTMIGSDQLSVDKFMEIDMTMAKQEGEGPQILIYHTHSQEAFADSVPGDVNTGIATGETTVVEKDSSGKTTSTTTNPVLNKDGEDNLIHQDDLDYLFVLLMNVHSLYPSLYFALVIQAPGYFSHCCISFHQYDLSLNFLELVHH